MKEKIQLLIKYKTWILISKNDIASGQRLLKRKQIYKIKQGVNNQITQFKARWLVKGYLQQAEVDFDQTFTAILKPMVF